MSIPSARRTNDGTLGPLRSGYMEVTFGEPTKIRRKADGNTFGSVAKDGQWWIPCTLPNGMVQYAFLNLPIDDQGNTRDLEPKKLKFFGQQMNTALDSAGVDDLAEVAGSTGVVKFTNVTKAGREAGKFSEIEIVTRADYDYHVANGTVVPDIDAPVQAVTEQAGRTGGKGRTKVNNPESEDEIPF